MTHAIDEWYACLMPDVSKIESYLGQSLLHALKAQSLILSVPTHSRCESNGERTRTLLAILQAEEELRFAMSLARSARDEYGGKGG